MLLKILLVASQTLWMHMASSPPQPPPPPNEQVKSGMEPYMGLLLTTRLTKMMNMLPLVVGLAEIAVILANQYPSYSVSSFIIANLLFVGSKNPSAIGLTLDAIIGSVLVSMGGALRTWCFRTLGRFFTFELSVKSNHALVTTGPYAYVRHPSYCGGLLMTVGALFEIFGRGGWVRESGALSTLVGKLVVAVWLVFVVFIGVIAIFQRTSTEDKMMKDAFGKEWVDWAKRVPYKVIPGVY